MAPQGALIRTAVPGLDPILGGGYTANDLLFIIGAPGAGKTILGSQMIFAAARERTPTLILTTLSEGHVKLMEHLSGFAFYDESLVGGAVQLLALQTLVVADPAATATAIARTIRESGAKLVLIDGFQRIAPLLPEAANIRRLLASLSSQLSYLNATVIVTLAGDARDSQQYAELTTADSIIGLDYTLEARKHYRYLEVVKRRGGAQLPGQHYYRIDTAGISVFPRLEVYPEPASHPHRGGRATFGLPELDMVLGGGLTAGTSTVLAGAPGTGKTTLGLHWALNDAHPDGHTLYIALHERPSQLQEKAAAFGLNLSAALESGAVKLLSLELVDLNPDIVAHALVTALVGTGARRLVIDDVNPLVNVLGPRAPDYFAALSAHLYGEGITSLILLEIAPFTGFHLDLTDTPVGILGENVVVIQQQEASGLLRRILAVLRMRFSDYDRTIRELFFNANGVRVLAPADTAVGVLHAAAAASGGVAPDQRLQSAEDDAA
jgi:circadian clock protein KaiC